MYDRMQTLSKNRLVEKMRNNCGREFSNFAFTNGCGNDHYFSIRAETTIFVVTLLYRVIPITNESWSRVKSSINLQSISSSQLITADI